MTWCQWLWALHRGVLKRSHGRHGLRKLIVGTIHPLKDLACRRSREIIQSQGTATEEQRNTVDKKEGGLYWIHRVCIYKDTTDSLISILWKVLKRIWNVGEKGRIAVCMDMLIVAAWISQGTFSFWNYFHRPQPQMDLSQNTNLSPESLLLWKCSWVFYYFLLRFIWKPFSTHLNLCVFFVPLVSIGQLTTETAASRRVAEAVGLHSNPQAQAAQAVNSPSLQRFTWEKTKLYFSIPCYYLFC